MLRSCCSCPIDNAERVVARDVFRKPDATRTKNAAFGVEHDAWPKVNRLRLVNLCLNEAARALAVIHRIFLQFAFARLIADRTVKRMIDEQRFQHTFAHLLYAGCVRVNFHSR